MKKNKLLSLALSFAICLSCSTAAMAAASPSVSSDTTKSIILSQSASYTVKFTVHGTHENPGITAGNSRILQTKDVKQLKDSSGNDIYFFKVKAVGKVGEKSAVYTTLPGQSPVKQFTVTVGKPVDPNAEKPIFGIDEPAFVSRGYTAVLSIQGKPHTAYTLTDQYKKNKATKIGTTTSDSKGFAKWTWKIGATTAPGTHVLTVTGGGQTYSTTLETN